MTSPPPGGPGWKSLHPMAVLSPACTSLPGPTVCKLCCQVLPLKRLCRDFLSSVPTTTTQVKATVSAEFNSKISFTPDSLNKAFKGKAMLGVWSGLRKQMREREVPREQECWMPLPLLAKGPWEDTVLPKPSESPGGSCCGWGGKEAVVLQHLSGEGGSFSPPLPLPSTGNSCWPDPMESRVEGTPKMQTSWSALSTKRGRAQIWRLKWRVRKTAGGTTKASPELPTLLFSIMCKSALSKAELPRPHCLLATLAWLPSALRVKWKLLNMAPWVEYLCAPQIHVLSPNPQCDGYGRWGFGRWLGREGEVLVIGISAFIAEIQRVLPLLPREDSGRSGHPWTGKLVLIRIQTLQLLDLGLPSPLTLTVRNKFLLFVSPLVCDILWQQLKLTWLRDAVYNVLWVIFPSAPITLCTQRSSETLNCCLSSPALVHTVLCDVLWFLVPYSLWLFLLKTVQGSFFLSFFFFFNLL